MVLVARFIVIIIIIIISLHAQRECGRVNSVGVHIYIYMFVDKKIFESYFNDRLTFSNIRCRTSCRIYRLAFTSVRARNAFSAS